MFVTFFILSFVLYFERVLGLFCRISSFSTCFAEMNGFLLILSLLHICSTYSLHCLALIAAQLSILADGLKLKWQSKTLWAQRGELLNVNKSVFTENGRDANTMRKLIQNTLIQYELFIHFAFLVVIARLLCIHSIQKIRYPAKSLFVWHRTFALIKSH